MATAGNGTPMDNCRGKSTFELPCTAFDTEGLSCSGLCDNMLAASMAAHGYLLLQGG